MLVVKIELHNANNGEISEIGRMIIANDGSILTGDCGHYDVKLARKGITDNLKIWKNPQKSARVEDYPRLSYTVWNLVYRALKNLGMK